MTRYLSSIGAFMLLLLLPAAALAERPDEPSKPADEESEPETIPLDQIWAYRMPGTRPMNASMRDGKYIGPEGQLLNDIRRSLKNIPPAGKKAAPGFAVLGTGVEALRHAHSVLVEGEQPRKRFPAGEEISVVFFSYRFGYYVHLDEVKRMRNKIVVYYRFVPHFTSELSEHIALIPLGALTANRMDVQFSRKPMDDKYIAQNFKAVDETWQGRIVCKSFSFCIDDPK